MTQYLLVFWVKTNYMEKEESNALFSSYERNENLFDEIFDANHKVRPTYKKIFELYSDHSISDFAHLNEKAKSSFFNQGITF